MCVCVSATISEYMSEMAYAERAHRYFICNRVTERRAHTTGAVLSFVGKVIGFTAILGVVTAGEEGAAAGGDTTGELLHTHGGGGERRRRKRGEDRMKRTRRVEGNNCTNSGRRAGNTMAKGKTEQETNTHT